VPEEAREVCNLPGITRELTLSEIAIVTRGAPARILGLTDRGHLAEGAVADVAVYRERKDKTAMFSHADLVFKDGALVVREGEVINVTWGRAFQVAPEFDAAIERRLDRFYDRYYGIGPSSFGVPSDIAGRPERFATVPCQI
jgi:formylmethanofuran dehydrogenase subunit A